MAGYWNTYRKQLQQCIEALPGQVFRRGDLTSDRSNSEQLRLNRALKFFIEVGLILKISHNLYAKAELAKVKDKEYKLLREPFVTVAYEALNKLNIQWMVGESVKAYNSGRSTQVPVVAVVRLNSRFRGTIGTGRQKLIFDGDINAR
jgi:hypothetical protein